MVYLWPWLGALLTLPLALAAGKSGDVVPSSYIVEFNGAQISTQSFITSLTHRGIPATLNHDLSFSLFHGGSFSLTGNPQNEAAIIKRISSLASVKSVTPVRELHLPPRQVTTARETSFQRRHANHLNRRGQNFATGANDIPHVMTGVDRLRDEGYLGGGLRVAVVDSGIDYKHPALGGCFGKGCLVSFGYNLLDNNTDPYDNCDGHGTHVSGLIAAQPNPYNFTGVAPNVTLGHYKVNKCKGGTSTDQIMQAFRMAFEDKADIITASIGGYSGWSEEPWGVLISRIVKAGVPCMVAVGNDGEYGMFYASDGADGKGATGVGAVNNVNAPMLLNKATYETRNGTKDFGWLLSGTKDFNNGTYQLYPLSLNTSVETDGCEALPSNTPDLSKKVVLIRRGGCGFSTKAANAANAGAKNILFYNNRPGVDQFSFTNDKLVGIGMVPTSTGEEWVKLAAKNTTITLRMTKKEQSSIIFITEKNNVAGGYVSDFSQWGPTNELVALPTISAPGGFMLSTYPLALGGYAVESGTSMATPYFAGCIALLFEARGKISADTVQSLFATNSNPNVFHDGASAYPWLDSVAQQGAGLINAYDAVHAKTLVNVSSISFNDTEHLTPASFSLKNTGSEDVTYTIGQVGSGTVYALSDDGTTIPAFFSAGDFMETTTNYASLSFSSKSVVVSAGKTAVVRVSATPPKGLDASRIPIYSGYVTLNGTNGDSMSIPYLGAATSMRNVTILDTKHGENFLKSTESDGAITAGHEFTFSGPSGPETNTSYPVFDLRLSMGTRLLEVDAKSSNGTVLGSIAQYPKEFQSRSATGPSSIEWQGYLADGTVVPAGSYSLLVRALKIFGNPAKKSDYDVVETPLFKVRYT